MTLAQLPVPQEVGAEKPNPVIFELACEALDVRPEEVVHVGDDRRWALERVTCSCNVCTSGTRVHCIAAFDHSTCRRSSFPPALQGEQM
jgi:FMN phosphatase YigB (HAD superfamily)